MKTPFEPQWLRLLRAVAVFIVILVCYAWVMEEDYVTVYEPLEPIRQSIEIIRGRADPMQNTGE